MGGRLVSYTDCAQTAVLGFELIPKTWEIRKVKSQFRIGRGRVISQEELHDTEGYPVFSSQTKDNGCLGFIPTFDFDCSQLTWTTDGANAGTVFLREGKHNCTNVCGTLLPMTGINLKFGLYSLSYATQFHKRPDTNGAKIMNNEMANIEIAMPPLPEQKTIAAFLDYETARIDELIAKQERLIELLKEKRQAVISHAVTKGLDPNVKMKDSGVEWLGEVPEHWVVTKFKYEVDYAEGPGILAVDFFDEGVPLIRIQNVKSYFVSDQFKSFLDPQRVKEKWTHFAVEAGDLLISCSASTGLVSEVDCRTAGAIPYTGLIRLRPKADGIIKDYIRLLVQSDMYVEQIERLQTGSTIQHYGPIHLQQMFICLPNVMEQMDIVNNVKSEVDQVDSIISKAESAIALMMERRSALISAAVTGKIDVRNWTPPANAKATTDNAEPITA